MKMQKTQNAQSNFEEDQIWKTIFKLKNVL